MNELELTRLFIDPLKSAQGIEVASAQVVERGLEPAGGIGLEPLRTLAGYRRQGKKVLFGQHLHALDLGESRAGQRGTANKNGSSLRSR